MAGGQATNSGIDYQQRIAAWCLVNQYSQNDISVFFDQIDEELIIEKTHFESDNAIDDLNLICANKKKIYLQIKRSLSLSARETSDFYKTIKQFVCEFISDENTDNYFGLITTSDASSKVTNDLKKIVLSIKLSNDALVENPFNESEKDTLKKLKELFDLIYEDLQKNKPSKNQFKLFVQRIFVSVIDIESGNSVEIAVLMLLKSLGFLNPELIWSVLIKNCLVYATNRLSIEQSKLKEVFDRYLVEENNKSNEQVQIDFLKTEIISQGKYSTAKEILLIVSFVEQVDFLIVELFRFKDDCQIKNRFKNDRLVFDNKEDWKVIQRFSTMAGLDRYMEENQITYQGKKIAILPANDIDHVEETECAKLHKEYLENLLKNNENILLCLHCGKQVNDDNSLLVEIEDMETPAAFGLVHKKCIRAIDRIMGTMKILNNEKDEYLESFDYKLWVKLMMKGQGMLNALKASPQAIQGRTPVIAWNSNEEYDSDYSYCIKFILEDGSTSYSYHRNKIQRVNKLVAEEHLELFNNIQKKQLEANDPWSVLSVSKTAGPYSDLIKMKEPDEEILEIKKAEISKYSKLIAKTFDKDLFYYAPLCIGRDKDTEAILNLSNVVPIISDPLNFKNLVKNWKKIGFELDSIELKIIKSDKDFDNYMRMIFQDNFFPILDPIFDLNFKLISGYLIRDYNQMINEIEEYSK
jgi:hypothetical protein